MSDHHLASPTAPQLRHFGRDVSLSVLVAFEILTIFIVGPLIGQHDAFAHIFAFTFTLIVVAGIFAVSRSTRAGLALVMMGVLILPLQIYSFYSAHSWVTLLYILLFIAFFTLLSYLIVLHVFSRTRINLHCILGGIAVYLHIGLIFALIFTLEARLLPDAFEMSQALTDEHTSLFAELLYFSFTTLTSVGYGDIGPSHPLTQSSCNLEGMIGQLFPAILLARLVSMELVVGSRKRQPPNDSPPRG